MNKNQPKNAYQGGSENFKGFIYCRGLDEAKKFLEFTETKLVDYKINYK